MPLQIKPNPTFKCKVGIPVPGADKMDVEFEFRHMRKSEFRALVESKELDTMPHGQVVMRLACGWSLPDAFTPENVDEFLENYHRAAESIWFAYGAELSGARLGN
jgi:hypothetical protein